MAGGSAGNAWAWLKGKVTQLKHSVITLYYAAHDPRTGWLPRAIAVVALAYALSPLDLIPDFIPVLGLLDDLLILPGLIWLAIRLIPSDVWADAQARADREPLRLKENWIAALCIFVIWDALAVYLTLVLIPRFGNMYLRLHWWIAPVAVGAIMILIEASWAVWTLTAEAERSREALNGEQSGDLEESLVANA